MTIVTATTNDTTTFTTPVVVTPIKDDTESTNENGTHAANHIDEELEDHVSHPKEGGTVTTFGVSTDLADDTSEGLPVSVASSTTTNTSSSSSTAAAVPPDNDSTRTPAAVAITETSAATSTSMTQVTDNTIAPIESQQQQQQQVIADVQTPKTTTTTTKKRPATLSSSRNRSSSVSSNTTGDTSTSHKSSYNYSPPSKHVKQYHEDDPAATNATTTAEEVMGKEPSPVTTTKPAPAAAVQKQQQPSKPLLASSSSSPSAVAKNWKQQSSVQAAELAALKQRGLAKLLNQHFTTTAQQLAIEKAAADAAILDLQERKARTSTFTPTNNSSEISPLDQACIQANKWRAECRRKERETLLLYQQYVHKFGPTTILPVPTVTTATTSTRRVVPTAPKIPPTAPSRPTPKEEEVERPVPTLVPSMTAQIEQTLDEYCARGAVAHPSIMTHGIDQTYSSIATKEEVAFREYYRKQLESKGADVICSPGYYKGNGTAIDAYTPTPEHDKNDNDDQWNNNNNDVCSIVSGLTTLHSALTREFLYDCEQSVATFLRDEQATVQKMLEDEEGDVSSSGDTHVSNVLVVQDSDATAKAAENMVQQMQDILQEYQKKHFGAGTSTETTAGPNDSKDNNKTYPHPYPTDNLNETWMVYYDELYRQEYYHETHTNRTQWDPPGGKTKNMHDNDPSSSYSHSTDVYSVMNGSISSDLLYEDYDYDERMDRILESNPNRVMAYRKRQRRKRRRRRIITTIVVTLTILLVGSGSYYLHCHSMNPSITGSSIDHPSSPKPAVCTAIDNHVMEQWNYLTHLISEDHPIIDEQVDPEPLLESSQPPKQCMLLLEDELYIRYYLQSTASPPDAANDEMIRRPWGCNIPLAYLFHAKCRRMATLRPIFDLQALINSMLQ